MHRLSALVVALVVLLSAGCPNQPVRSNGRGQDDSDSDGGGEQGADGGTLEAPAPYSTPAAGAPLCELSADCPAGTHCDLGECFQACSTDQACDQGLLCNERGRCVKSADEPTDPPTPTTSVKLVAQDSIIVAREQKEFEIKVEASGASEALRYRIEPGVNWIRATTARGEFTNNLTVRAVIDRSLMTTVSASANLTVHTSHGSVNIPVYVEDGLTGVYQGELAYTTPRALGRVPLRVEIVESLSGYLSMRVNALYSPTFRAKTGSFPTFTGRMDPQGKLTARLVQAITKVDLGGSAALVPHDIGRTLDMELNRSGAGGLAGKFTETWRGLFPQDAAVTGTVTLARLYEVTAPSFAAATPPTLPNPPSVNPPALDAACSLPQLPCVSSSTTEALLDCGNQMLKYGLRLEETKLLSRAPTAGADAPFTARYQDTAKVCVSEQGLTDAAPWVPADWYDGGATIDNPWTNVVETLPVCVRPRSLDCAEAAFGIVHRRGDPDGTDGLARVVSARASLSLLLVNERLVETFELPYRSEDGAIESKVIESLGAAHTDALFGIRRVLSPFTLAALRDLPGSIARKTDYRALRRAAQLVSRDRLALDEAARVQMRAPKASLESIKERADRDALNLLLALVSLSTVEAAQAAPPSPELGLFAGSLSGLTSKSHEMQEAIDSKRALDPMGEPEGFIAFVYDPTRASEGPTNYEQLLSAGAEEIAAASTAESNARTAIETFETNKEVLADALLQIDVTLNRQLGGICGFQNNLPDIENCGKSGGTLLEANQAWQLEIVGIDLAQSRIDGLGARAEIQTQRLKDIMGVREETIAFIGKNNETVNALTHVQNYVNAARDFLGVAANTNLFNGGAPVGLAVASSFLTLLNGQLELQKDMLRQTQELRIMEANAEAEVIDGMAVIKDILVGMGELNIELRMAGIRAMNAATRVANIEQEKNALVAERAMLLAQQLDKRANDPTFRVLRNDAVHKAIATREAALLAVYRSARAFELEINSPFPAIRDMLVPALRMEDVADFITCMKSNLGKQRVAYGSSALFTDEISVRRDVLGIRASITDDVTGETITEAQQFQRLLLQPSNLGTDGTVGFKFAMTLEPANGVWSNGLCNDQLRTIQVKLVGDQLGDQQATVRMRHAGSAFMRSCESNRNGQGDVVHEYSVWTEDGNELASGVNAFPDSAAKDSQFFGRPVAASEWEIAIPSGSDTPRNRDLDPKNIEDIVLRVEHSGISLGKGPIAFSPACDF